MTYYTHILGSARARGRRDSFVTRLMAALALGQQRHDLSQLSDAQLDDIGITRAQAQREAKRPIWDAPYCGRT